MGNAQTPQTAAVQQKFDNYKKKEKKKKPKHKKRRESSSEEEDDDDSQYEDNDDSDEDDSETNSGSDNDDSDDSDTSDSDERRHKKKKKKKLSKKAKKKEKEKLRKLKKKLKKAQEKSNKLKKKLEKERDKREKLEKQIEDSTTHSRVSSRHSVSIDFANESRSVKRRHNRRGSNLSMGSHASHMSGVSVASSVASTIARKYANGKGKHVQLNSLQIKSPNISIQRSPSPNKPTINNDKDDDDMGDMMFVGDMLENIADIGNFPIDAKIGNNYSNDTKNGVNHQHNTTKTQEMSWVNEPINNQEASYGGGSVIIKKVDTNYSVSDYSQVDSSQPYFVNQQSVTSIGYGHEPRQPSVLDMSNPNYGQYTKQYQSFNNLNNAQQYSNQSNQGQ